MQQILNQLYQYKTLSKQEAKNILLEISDGKYNNSQIASFLTAFNMRKISVDELEGFRDALLERCLSVDLSEFSPVDLCGTGGDGKNTFNISTLAAFVTAGAGINVAKHGNTGVSSGCGSSDVLQFLGCSFTNKEECLKKQLKKSGFCYLHAPLFHPAMKNVAPVRKEIKVKTIFNMLGPLVNPAGVKYQSVGVFSLELARLYNYLLQKQDCRFAIYHSLDGYDEISLTSPFKYISVSGEQLMTPENLNMKIIRPDALSVHDSIQNSADVFMKILSGKGDEAQNSVVIVNAAAAIKCVRPDQSFIDCISLTANSLKTGNALKSFELYKECAKGEKEPCKISSQRLFM